MTNCSTTRIVLCGGGTGGHVYPLLAVRAALIETGNQRHETERVASPVSNTNFLFIGGVGIEQDLVARESVPYQSVSGGGLHGVGVRSALPNLLKLVAGFFQARRVLTQFKPHAILATGGFITVPVALAAAIRRIPMVVYLPDIEPALSVRVLGWLATKVTATAEVSQQFFAARKFVLTGYPIRRELLQAAQQPREAARAEFGIAPAQKVVLVFGGSRGARSLNRALLAHLEALLPMAEFIHIGGTGEWDEVRAAHDSLPDALRARYHAFPYLHEQMGAALAAADLVVSRSGASTLGEFPLFGLPSILVPYPHAWRYQEVNADYLARKGAGVIVRDEDLMQQLAPTIGQLLNDDAARSRMSEAAHALAKPLASEAIGRVVMRLTDDRRQQSGALARTTDADRPSAISRPPST
ncbi:MAG: UDP-N-acetylglucosamine--N-acetylmuramyl-(pentapeptide) pyrophosphoryl-undecaprenol N-acetylglucosamine transferase [Chloroflexi bacterium]|nr:UDP-N-acetylglucosamine--N-acetylmuramyl-(pentapeptide) pyrophosphoryl-undecaprenol N-acetylglucosamine transferase [Chloroflexota bacterium]